MGSTGRMCRVESRRAKWNLSYCIVFHPHSVSSFFLFYLHVGPTLKTQNTKLVHASTTASSSSAMLEKHGSTHSSRSTRSSRLARQSRTCRVVSNRAKWNLGLCTRRMHSELCLAFTWDRRHFSPITWLNLRRIAPCKSQSE